MNLRARATRTTSALVLEARYCAGVVASRWRETDHLPKVFVVGSGRSGTHWIGRALSSPNIVSVFEERPAFAWSAEMAQYPAREKDLYEPLCSRYRAIHALAMSRTLAVKHHPNLWLAERLAETFPGARFIAIRRKLFGTVASMLHLTGTRNRATQWDSNPTLNRMLGVTPDLIEVYRTMSTAARCAVRVIAHSREIDRLRSIMGNRMLTLDYEDVHSGAMHASHRITSFLGSDSLLAVPEPQPDALLKWQSDLSSADVLEIANTAEMLTATDMLETHPAAV